MGLNKRLFTGDAGTIVATDNFNTVIYAGNQTARSITGLDFTPDLVWIKSRNETNLHVLTDSVRGTNKQLFSNGTDAQSTSTNRLTGFDSNGFSIAAGNSLYRINKNGINYVAWCWKAPDAFDHLASGSGSGSTLASSGKSNQPAGFSIVKFAVPSVSNGQSRKIKHNLGGIPELIIYKTLNSSQATSWFVNTLSIGNNHELFLNTADAKSGSARWNNTTPDATTFDIGPPILDYTGGSNTNFYGGDTIAYCFKSIAGYSSIGTYTGNTSTFPTVSTGFQPAFVMIKRTDSNDNWLIFDTKRDTSNPTNIALIPNSGAAESVGNLGNGITLGSDGFVLNSTDTGINANNGIYLYWAIKN